MWHSNLPTFHSRDELLLAPSWDSYLSSVYGRLPDASQQGDIFPLRLQEFTFFYERKLPVALPQPVPMFGVESSIRHFIPDSTEELTPVRHRHGPMVGRQWRDTYQLYVTEPGMGSRLVWVYAHGRRELAEPPQLVAPLFPGAAGFQSDTRVEVFMCAEDDAATGLPPAMFHSRGSGVFFALGRTFVAANLLQAASALNVTSSPMYNIGLKHLRCRPRHGASSAAYCDSPARELQAGNLLRGLVIRALSRGGYESLQLTHAEAHGIFKFIIYDVRRSAGAGPSVCPTACPLPPATSHYFTGWKGTEACKCDSRHRCLNCGETSLLPQPARQQLISLIGMLPSFQNASELARHREWRRYLRLVYGAPDLAPDLALDLAPDLFPLHTRRLGFFYYNFLPRALRRAVALRPLLGSTLSTPSIRRVQPRHKGNRVVTGLKDLSLTFTKPF